MKYAKIRSCFSNAMRRDGTRDQKRRRPSFQPHRRSPRICKTQAYHRESLCQELWIHIERIPPGYGPYNPIESLHDLFYLLGNYQMFPRAIVQITFPNAPPGVTHAEILVCRMATDSL